MQGINVNARRFFRVFLAIGVMLVLGASLVGSTGRDLGVLIVTDEVEQMEVLAEYMKAKGAVDFTIVLQKDLPGELSSYDAVIGYVHGKAFP